MNEITSTGVDAVNTAAADTADTADTADITVERAHDRTRPAGHPGQPGRPGHPGGTGRPGRPGRPERPDQPRPGLPSQLNGLRKFRDPLTVPPVIRMAERGQRDLTVRAQVARARLHADLPETTAWAYEGSLPGPTIEVERGQEARITWANDLGTRERPAHLPFDVVRVPLRTLPTGARVPDTGTALAPGGRSTSRGGPGARQDAFPPVEHTEALTAATVVHLHGALTNGHNDGWAHNVARPGEVTRCAYPNRQESTTLWYHDHAMAVTRFNVPSGLAGFYLIRDEQERSLGLPSGEHELPLMIADRNLETDEQGRFTGRMLYKVAGLETAAGEPGGEIPMSGPFTMVNGRIWPTAALRPRWYRLRLLNACNARVLTLALHDTTEETPGVTLPIEQGRLIEGGLVVIGTDGGLLPAPHRTSTLRLGPGERADVLVDLRPHAGRTLELRNVERTAINAVPARPEDRVPLADASVMQITVTRTAPGARDWEPRARLSTEYRRYQHTHDGRLLVGDRVIESHEHTWIGIIPVGVRGSTHPELWELAPVPHGAALPTQDLIQLTQRDGTVVSLHPVAKLFDDAVTIRLAEGDWAVWNLVHLGGPEHPLHIHMTEFQMLTRSTWALDAQTGRVPQYDLTTGSTTSPMPAPTPQALTPLEEGMKDTWVIRPGEWVQVLGEFAGANGSFMYHCHILDHEDVTMMRPFVVLPPDVLAFHAGHGGGHGRHG